jgi:hypothetical protein
LGGVFFGCVDGLSFSFVLFHSCSSSFFLLCGRPFFTLIGPVLTTRVAQPLPGFGTALLVVGEANVDGMLM